MSVVFEQQSRDAARWAVGVVSSIAINALVAHAIYESSVGTVFMLDDSPPDGSFAVPFVAGAVLGLMQVRLFGMKIVLVATVLNLFGRLFLEPWAWDELGALLVMCFGGVLGWLVGLVLPTAGRKARAVSTVALVASAVVAVVSLVPAPSDPVPVPLIRTLIVPEGPAVLMHTADRDVPPSRSGTLADVDGCLGVIDVRPDARRFVVIWPRGTTVELDPYSITIDGATHHLGDEVIVSNVLRESATDTRYFEGAPASCATNALIL